MSQPQLSYRKASSFVVAIGVLLFLVPLQMFLKKPILLAERFITGAGWFQIAIMVLYGVGLAWVMADKSQIAKWRNRLWSFFSIVFFAQLFVGLLGVDECLMTGKLHFPIPAMIVLGPVYRGELSVMTLIFISTLILAGPAWCSYFCYFGAIDGLAASGKTSRKPLANKTKIRHSVLALTIVLALGLRFMGISGWLPSTLIILFAIVGFGIMIWFSRKHKKMVHCTTYCPVGTIVTHLKVVSPFRISIMQGCDTCMRCVPSCKYDALNLADLKQHKPASSCTLCGDCLSSCHDGFIQYRLFKMDGEKARFIFINFVIILHIMFLNSARI